MNRNVIPERHILLVYLNFANAITKHFTAVALSLSFFLGSDETHLRISEGFKK